MKYLILAFGLYAAQSLAIEVIQPEPQTAEISISSPDDTVQTLGTVDFIIDWRSSNDTLAELKIRRQDLKLEDGRIVDVFAHDPISGMTVGASSPVSQVSIHTVQGEEILALFHNNQNEVIAPSSKDIGIYDKGFSTVPFDYDPAVLAGEINIDVSILIDSSGSMDSFMPLVLRETRAFMKGLPDFTRCHVYSFGSTVKKLTQSDVKSTQPCSQSTNYLDNSIVANGATAMFAALEDAIRAPRYSSATHLIVMVTDGVNTVEHALNERQLGLLKQQENAMVLVFWAGHVSKTHLDDIADYQTSSATDVKTDLNRFFQTIGVSVSGMQTLKIR